MTTDDLKIEPDAPKEQDYKIFLQALSAQEQEDLVILFRSPHWQTYRKILIGMKSAAFQQMLPCKEAVEISKQLGMVVGINLAINQLGLLTAQIEKARRVAGETKNQPKPSGH